MVSIKKEITIDASPEIVKKTFFDFESHAQWDPFMVLFKAPDGASPGNTLDIDLMIKGDSKTTNMKPVVQVNTDEEFLWKGKLGFDLIFVGKHYFRFKAVDGGKTQFTQGEDFGGILVPLLSMIGIFTKTEASFGALNEALKKEAELRASSSQ